MYGTILFVCRGVFVCVNDCIHVCVYAHAYGFTRDFMRIVDYHDQS